jgi:hypothetical protein
MTGSNEQNELTQIPTDFESVLQFCLGTRDAVRTLIAGLIGLGIVPPAAFQADFQRMADFWAQQGNAIRREPSANIVEALKDMERVKLGMPAQMVDPSSVSTTRN